MDTLAKIKDLQDKKAKAATASTRVATQVEALEGEKDGLEQELQENFSITFEQVETELERLAEEQAARLADAEEAFSKINL